MNKFIILSEYCNLNGIASSKKENYQNYISGDNVTRRQLIPSYMLERGEEFEVDFSKLDETQLRNLCEKEGCLAIVRIDTNYNKEVKKQGLEADLYKTKLGNETKFTNSIMPEHVINQFCQNWEDKKAYILNSAYSRYYLPLIDKFYLELIKKNNN